MIDSVSAVAAAPRSFAPTTTPIAARNVAPAPAEGEPTDPSKTRAMDGEPTDPDVVGGARGRFNAVA